MKKTVSGINIQYPISTLILDGSKTVETRTYPIPKKYIGIEMAIIETPGPNGDFSARIMGTIVFGESFRYKSSKEFYLDQRRHCVDKNSSWKWNNTVPKWGWPILEVKKFAKPIIAPSKKGIKFTLGIKI